MGIVLKTLAQQYKSDKAKIGGDIARYQNPYEKSGTSESIYSEIKKYLLQNKTIEKNFYDIS